GEVVTFSRLLPLEEGAVDVSSLLQVSLHVMGVDLCEAYGLRPATGGTRGGTTLRSMCCA
ncbi:MAG: hypothetical protein ACE5IJ_10355, partial [Thermoplasmata archaeon]